MMMMRREGKGSLFPEGKKMWKSKEGLPVYFILIFNFFYSAALVKLPPR